MRRVVIPEKSKLINEIASSDPKDFVFNISPQKKAKLESVVSEKNHNALRVLREWMEKDEKKALIKKMLASDD